MTDDVSFVARKIGFMEQTIDALHARSHKWQMEAEKWKRTACLLCGEKPEWGSCLMSKCPYNNVEDTKN